MSNATDIARRKRILLQSIGQDVQLKRGTIRPKHRLCGQSGRLLDVRRTRVLVGFPIDRASETQPLFDEWTFPIAWVLLPGSIEPLPGQRELFAATEATL